MTLRQCSRAVVCLALLLSPVAGLMAQGNEAGTVVEGVVKDAAGKPLGEITIRAVVYTEDKPQAQSSPDGRFRLALNADAFRSNTRLIASNRNGDLQGFLQLNLIDPSQLDEPVEIVMKPPREISVVLRNADGHPLEDAHVEVAAVYSPVASGLTDAEGVWRTKIPADAPVGYVIALKDGAGFDYYQNAHQFEDDPNSGLPDEFELTLDGAIDVEVLAATDDGDPVAGIEMQPWTIQKPGRADNVNVGGSRIVRTATDERGIAVFRWFPAKFEQSITMLMRSDEWHAPDWPSLLAGAVEHRLTYKLRRMVSISGRIIDADGQPAPGIQVQIAGEGANFRDNHQATVVSDAAGGYRALVPPQCSYIIAVADDDWASEPLMDIPIYTGRPRDDLDLTLIPGTLVHGSVRQPDGTPLARQYMIFRLDGKPAPFTSDDGSRSYHAPSLTRGAVTDEDGRYELRVGPGKYLVWGPDYRNSQELTIVDQPEQQLDFEYQPRTKQPLTGLVVRADDEDVAVPHAKVSVVQIDPSDYRDFTVEADDMGRFSTERFPARVLLHAMTRDGALGATREMQKDDTDVVIAVAPTSSAVGRIVDEQGQPVAGFRFRNAIHVQFPDGTTSARFGGTVLTEDDGSFRLEHLVVNQPYECWHQIDNHYHLVTKVMAPDAETVDLGTITYPRNERNRTYVEWLRDVFEHAGERDTAVETAANVAALDGRRVLLIEGSADDPLVRSLFRVFDDDSRTWEPSRDPLTKNLAHYILAGVSQAGTQATENGSRLIVLDQDRSVVFDTPLGELTRDSGDVDATLLTQFLEAHLPEPTNADERMSQAMEASEQSGKPILVVQVAAHDDQSERMLEFVAGMRPLLERHFILFPVADHMARGRDLTNALRESLVQRYVDRSQRQVPWTAVIDASGARLAAAEIDDNTVGYPHTPEQISQFLITLQIGAPAIGDAELKQLRAALLPEK